nr:hypothetical protein [uncultured Anaerostipes sp.]
MRTLLRLKRSHRNTGEWILYNPDNFALHTHCRSKRVALVIKSNVERHRLPRSRNLRTLESHIRVTGNQKYIRQIEQLIQEIKHA